MLKLNKYRQEPKYIVIASMLACNAMLLQANGSIKIGNNNEIGRIAQIGAGDTTITVGNNNEIPHIITNGTVKSITVGNNFKGSITDAHGSVIYDTGIEQEIAPVVVASLAVAALVGAIGYLVYKTYKIMVDSKTQKYEPVEEIE
jgi:hypothetical protein